MEIPARLADSHHGDGAVRGLAEPAACNAHYDALRALHFTAAGLQCEGIPLPAGAIERFRAAFGASPRRASVSPSQVDPS